MIELYAPSGSVFGDKIEEQLIELVVAYKRIPLADEGDPWVKSGKEVYEAEAEIELFINRLRYEVTMNRLISSDACFIDPESGDGCPL